MSFRNRLFAWCSGYVLDRLILSVLLVFAAALCVMSTGCKPASVNTPASATAPTDPYAKALNYLSVFSQALLDAKVSVVALHTTQIAWTDGTMSPVLDDDAYAKVNTGLSFLATEGTKLSNLLAARATPAQISTEMAAMTAALSAQLSPSAVGIKNPSAQQKYVVVTSLVSLALNTLVAYVATIPAPQEGAALEPSRNRRSDPVAQYVGSYDPHRRCADPEGSASLAAGRPYRATRRDQREFRQGAGLVAPALA